MNRYRLNQIVKILLFPFIDLQLGKQDYLLSCYVSYNKFQKLVKSKSNSAMEREKRNNDYIQSKRRLYEYLLERNHWKAKNEDDVEQICNIYYSMEELDKYVNFIQGITGEENSEEHCVNCYYILEILPSISCSLITYRDGMAAIRPWIKEDKKDRKEEIFNSGSIFSKIEIWSLLGRIMSPDILIAVAAVENGLEIQALYEQDFNILLADKLLVKSLQNGLAENHIHFNVGIDYQMIWLGYMNISFVEKINIREYEKLKQEQKEKISKRIQMALFRYFAADYMERQKNDFSSYLEQEVSPGIKEIMFRLYRRESMELTQETISDIVRLNGSICTDNSIYGEDYLYDKVYEAYVELKTASEFLLLYKAYKYIKEHKEDKVFVHFFLQYIRMKNEFYQNYHEEYFLQGLTYFQKQYNQARRTTRESIEKEKLLIEIFRSQAKIKYLKKLEIRVAPEVPYEERDYFEYKLCRRDILSHLYGQLLKILEAYRRFLMESILGVGLTNKILIEKKKKKFTIEEQNEIYAKISVSAKKLPNIGIVFHFLKRSYLENTTSYYCWRNSISYGERQNVYGMQRRYFIQNIAIALEEIRQNIPKIDEYIVGLDSASNENMEEPWMYASAYRIVRSHNITKPVVMFKEQERYYRLQNIGLTYHVGEDFRHILSGFRHVDEVLTEFGYKPGDRLGHALVLGVDIKEWIRNNEIIALPMIEYMEDLLWLWGINLYSGIELGISLEILEDKILTLVRDIYINWETITVRTLYYAYKKKFECNHKEIAKKYIEDNETKSFCRWNEKDKTCYEQWDEEKLLLTYYCPVFQKKYNKTILVSIDLKQASMYQKIQDYLVKKTEEKGVYIEMNPTSNETIGDFSNMVKHPIFYLNPAGRDFMHRAMVTVNSDDPLVFSTNVENEMAYIYYAAEAQGISKEEIMEWIEKIRTHGMNASFIQQEKDNVQVLKELDIMIETIEKIQYKL